MNQIRFVDPNDADNSTHGLMPVYLDEESMLIIEIQGKLESDLGYCRSYGYLESNSDKYKNFLFYYVKDEYLDEFPPCFTLECESLYKQNNGRYRIGIGYERRAFEEGGLEYARLANQTSIIFIAHVNDDASFLHICKKYALFKKRLERLKNKKDDKRHEFGKKVTEFDYNEINIGIESKKDEAITTMLKPCLTDDDVNYVLNNMPFVLVLIDDNMGNVTEYNGNADLKKYSKYFDKVGAQNSDYPSFAVSFSIYECDCRAFKHYYELNKRGFATFMSNKDFTSKFIEDHKKEIRKWVAAILPLMYNFDVKLYKRNIEFPYKRTMVFLKDENAASCMIICLALLFFVIVCAFWFF